MKYVDVSISDNRIFQHIVLLVDRPDFVIWSDVAKIILTNYHKKTLSEEYGAIPKEIHTMASEYKYPVELEPAILAAVVKNKVTDKDVEGYNPARRTKQNDNKYKAHPILGLRINQAIKTHRTLYVLHMQHKLGYRKLSKYRDVPLTTVQTAIESYSDKLFIKLQ